MTTEEGKRKNRRSVSQLRRFPQLHASRSAHRQTSAVKLQTTKAGLPKSAHQKVGDIVFFVYCRCAKTQKHSGATFRLLVVSFSPCQRNHNSWHSPLDLLPNVMLLPCIRATLNGQLDLLWDESGPRVAGGAELRAQPFVSLHIVSLEAW